MATRNPPPSEEPQGAAGEVPPALAPSGEESVEIKQYIYHVNPATNQVIKVEELDSATGDRKEVPVDYQNYDTYGDYEAYGNDPYSGYDMSGYEDPYSGYDMSGYEDPYGGYDMSAYEDPAGGYGDPYGAYDPSGGYDAYSLGAGDFSAAPWGPPPPCIPPRCLPPRCLPPRCLPPQPASSDFLTPVL